MTYNTDVKNRDFDSVFDNASKEEELFDILFDEDDSILESILGYNEDGSPVLGNPEEEYQLDGDGSNDDAPEGSVDDGPDKEDGDQAGANIPDAGSAESKADEEDANDAGLSGGENKVDHNVAESYDMDFIEEYYWLDEDGDSFYVNENDQIVYEELSEKAKKRLKTIGKIAAIGGGAVAGTIAAQKLGKKAYDKGGKFHDAVDKVRNTKVGSAAAKGANTIDNGANKIGSEAKSTAQTFSAVGKAAANGVKNKANSKKAVSEDVELGAPDNIGMTSDEIGNNEIDPMLMDDKKGAMTPSQAAEVNGENPETGIQDEALAPYWLDENGDSFYLNEDNEVIYEELSDKAKARLKKIGKVAAVAGGAIAGTIAAQKLGKKVYNKGGKFHDAVDKIRNTKVGAKIDQGANTLDMRANKAVANQLMNRSEKYSEKAKKAGSEDKAAKYRDKADDIFDKSQKLYNKAISSGKKAAAAKKRAVGEEFSFDIDDYLSLDISESALLEDGPEDIKDTDNGPISDYDSADLRDGSKKYDSDNMEGIEQDQIQAAMEAEGDESFEAIPDEDDSPIGDEDSADLRDGSVKYQSNNMEGIKQDQIQAAMEAAKLSIYNFEEATMFDETNNDIVNHAKIALADLRENASFDKTIDVLGEMTVAKKSEKDDDRRAMIENMIITVSEAAATINIYTQQKLAEANNEEPVHVSVTEEAQAIVIEAIENLVESDCKDCNGPEKMKDNDNSPLADHCDCGERSGAIKHDTSNVEGIKQDVINQDGKVNAEDDVDKQVGDGIDDHLVPDSIHMNESDEYEDLLDENSIIYKGWLTNLHEAEDPIDISNDDTEDEKDGAEAAISDVEQPDGDFNPDPYMNNDEDDDLIDQVG